MSDAFMLYLITGMTLLAFFTDLEKLRGHVGGLDRQLGVAFLVGYALVYILFWPYLIAWAVFALARRQ